MSDSGYTTIVTPDHVDSNADPNELTGQSWPRNQTGFLKACETGATETVSLLLNDSRIDVNEGDDSGKTGFILACEYGHTQIVSLLLQNSRVDVNKADVDGQTGFMEACSYGCTEIVSLLFQDSRIDIFQEDNDGMSGFIYACRSANRDVLSLFLKDARIGIDDQFICACCIGDMERVSLSLNNPRINVNKANNDGMTGFIWACRNGHAEIVSSLLAHSRIKVNQNDLDGWTGLLWAILQDHTEIVSLLLQNSRIKVNTRDKDGWTEFMSACDRENEEVVSLLLQDPRIDVNAEGPDGITGFLFACSAGREIVSELSESERVDCACGWKVRVDRLCRRLSETVMRENEQQNCYIMWRELNGLGMGVFIRGWNGENERMKEVWIYGDRERRKKYKRSSEMISKRETEWRRVSDYLLEADITSVLLLCHCSEMVQDQLNSEFTWPEDLKDRVDEMESQ